jgi:hypothetical protein
MAERRGAGIEIEEYTEQGGARELVFFVANGLISFINGPFRPTTRWKEHAYLLTTGRRVVPARLLFCPQTGKLTLVPESLK